jgi:hypothetical protein
VEVGTRLLDTGLGCARSLLKANGEAMGHVDFTFPTGTTPATFIRDAIVPSRVAPISPLAAICRVSPIATGAA